MKEWMGAYATYDCTKILQASNCTTGLSVLNPNNFRSAPCTKHWGVKLDGNPTLAYSEVFCKSFHQPELANFLCIGCFKNHKQV